MAARLLGPIPARLGLGPAHYVWSPSGYLFVDGYWDRPLMQRGMMFAPVYFQQPLYRQPNYVYTPTISLLPAPS